MKHPARSDFHTVVTATGVSVTFKPTNSTYSFYRFARCGSLSLAGIQHAGRDTDDYPSNEVQDMAQQIASGHASAHFGPFQDKEGVNRVHWENFARQAKRDTEPTSESIAGAAAVSDSAHKAASDPRMLAQVEKWIAIIREISREQADRHRVDCAI
jgi:cytochrome c1